MNDLLAGGPTVTLLILGGVGLAIIAAIRYLARLITKAITILAISATGLFGAGTVNNFDINCVITPQTCSTSQPANGANR